MTDIAERDELKRKLSELRKQIEVAERATAGPEVLMAAINQAERDRDAVTSPEVEDLRETVENLADKIESCWISNVHTLVNIERLAGCDLRDKIVVPARLRESLTELAEARARVVRRLTEAHIDYVNVPVLPDCPTVDAGAVGGTG